MKRPEEPTWLGTEDLALVASMLDAQVQGAREQHETLLKARPYVLDDHTVRRLAEVWGDTATTCGSTTPSSTAGRPRR